MKASLSMKGAIVWPGTGAAASVSYGGGVGFVATRENERRHSLLTSAKRMAAKRAAKKARRANRKK